ncbi:O-acyltransferase like protein-like [Babylonia areolata]|uniref:O-acyltransferase like protein-like n=1 Tax=Babylonia areolata TaxID=304850 RepID=UPI003FCFA6AB
MWLRNLALAATILSGCVVVERSLVNAHGHEEEAEDQMSSLCVNQTRQLQVGVVTRQTWALRIQDSNGRPGPGVLRHRLTWLGSYEQCVSTQMPPLAPPLPPSVIPTPLDWMPRYCLASVTLQEFEDDVTRVGQCFPDGCSGRDVQLYLQQNGGFQGLEELQLKVKSVDHVTCQAREVSWRSSTVTVVAFLCLLGAVLGFATVYQLAVSSRQCEGKAGARGAGNRGGFLNIRRHRGGGRGGGRRGGGGEPEDLARLLLRGRGQEEDEAAAAASSSSSSSSSAAGVPTEYTMLLKRPITPRQPRMSRVTEIMKCFSLCAGVRRLTQADPGVPCGYQGEGQGQEHEPPGSLPCLHGLRALSLLWAIHSHTHYFATEVPTANLKEAWESSRTRFLFQPVLNSFLAADTFFFISGLLVCFLSLREMTIDRTGIHLLRFYARRLWRVVAVYMVVMAVVMHVLPYVGEGPLWSESSVLTEHCAANWWSNLLFVNNLVHSDRMCLEWTWYLACDIQFYLLSPALVLILHHFPAAGLFVSCVVVVLPMVLTGVISTCSHLVLTPLSLQQFSSAGYMGSYLVKPYCRASSYVVGILTGYCLHRTRCQLRIHPVVKVIVWIVAAISCGSLLFGTMAAANGAPVSQSTTSFYFAMSHVVWALGVAWVTVLCCTRNANTLAAFLSWGGWVPLSRLSLCVFLVHPVIIVTYFITLRTPFFITPFTMCFAFIGNTIISFASAFVIYLGIESPTKALIAAVCGSRI